jgi:hypothetical protein
MRITEMPISSEEKDKKFDELLAFGKEMFEGRLGLNLNEVMDTSFFMVKNENYRHALHMASLDKKLNLTDDEHKKMAEFLENLL